MEECWKEMKKSWEFQSWKSKLKFKKIKEAKKVQINL